MKKNIIATFLGSSQASLTENVRCNVDYKEPGATQVVAWTSKALTTDDGFTDGTANRCNIAAAIQVESTANADNTYCVDYTPTYKTRDATCVFHTIATAALGSYPVQIANAPFGGEGSLPPSSGSYIGTDTTA